MPLFQYKCPSCNQNSLIDPQGQCQARLKNGSICAYKLPFNYRDGNRVFRKKMCKHTSAPPGSLFTGIWSWTSSSGAYEEHQEITEASGSVQLDPLNNYLFLWCTPSGDNTIAKVMYGDTGTVTNASGVIMPLNSQLSNLHHFYGNWMNHFQSIADGPGIILEQPNDLHPEEYHVLENGKLIYKYNPVTKIATDYRV